MTDKTLFEKIVDREIPNYIVWENEQYAAFLTPFANTEGMTIVVPKKNPGGYLFALDDDVIAGLMSATKQVARLLEKAFETERIALVFEGQEVPHVHAKLYPMHNLNIDRSEFPKHTTFFPSYPGYISTSSGPEMADAQLKEVQAKIVGAMKSTNAAGVSDEN